MKRITSELFLLSLASLFFELLVIRWFAADIRAFCVFKTFPLITCFVGLGLGYALRSDKVFRYALIAMLVFLAIFKQVQWLGSATLTFPTISVWAWNNFDWLSDLTSTVGRLSSFMLVLAYTLFGPFICMLCIGSRLGVLFDKMDPLRAYGVNIIGSIAGSALFTLLCYLCVSPALLLMVPVLLVAAYSPWHGWHRVKAVALVVAMIALASWQIMPPLSSGFPEANDAKQVTYWSPYQRLDLTVFNSKDAKGTDTSPIGVNVGVNHYFYQWYFTDNQGLTKLSPQLAQLIHDRRVHYELPYHYMKPKDVLVLGAGTGQDVSAALKCGAQHVDAVDIDPVILDIGRKYNPDYSSDKVSLFCDDARHFLETTPRKYDCVVFCLLDSQAVVGQGSSVRLDSYVYSKQGIEKAIGLLKNDGVLVLSFACVAPWTYAHLAKTVAAASGQPVLSMGAGPDLEKSSWAGQIYFVVRKGTAMNPSEIPPHHVRLDVPNLTDRMGRTLTDDWPYLYVRPDVVDVPYLLVLLECIVISVVVGRKLLFGVYSPRNWQMFFLGAGFMLLELQSISHLSLLYGSTWLTSSIVINGVLIMIFLANWFVIKQNWLSNKLVWLYALQLAAIVISYFFPARQMMGSQAGYVITTVVVLLPMLMASVIFSVSFGKVESASRCLGFNLFGAVVGGLLEFLSNYLGINNMLLLAAGFYALSAYFGLVPVPSRLREPESAPVPLDGSA